MKHHWNDNDYSSDRVSSRSVSLVLPGKSGARRYGSSATEKTCGEPLCPHDLREGIPGDLLIVEVLDWILVGTSVGS